MNLSACNRTPSYCEGCCWLFISGFPEFRKGLQVLFFTRGTQCPFSNFRLKNYIWLNRKLYYPLFTAENGGIRLKLTDKLFYFKTCLILPGPMSIAPELLCNICFSPTHSPATSPTQMRLFLFSINKRNSPQRNRYSMTKKTSFVSCFSPSHETTSSSIALPWFFLFICSSLLIFPSVILLFSFPSRCLPESTSSVFQSIKFCPICFSFRPSWTCRLGWGSQLHFWTFAWFFVAIFRRSVWKTSWKINFPLRCLPFIFWFCRFTAGV